MTITRGDFGKVRGYEYQDGLRFVPVEGREGELHAKVLKKVLDRADVASEGERSDREASWNEMDKKLMAYVDLTKSEQVLKQQRPDIPVRVVIPYTYATMETLLTYLTMSLLSQDPIFSFDAVNSKDFGAVRFLQDLVQRQMGYFKGQLSLYTMFRDGLGYGLGAVFPFWQTEYRWMKERVPNMVESLDQGMVQDGERVDRVGKAIFAGTKLKNVHARQLLLDPSKSPHDVQGASFVGWVEETNQYTLLDLERSNPEEWFNVRYLKFTSPGSKFCSVYKEKGLVSRDEDVKPVYLVHLICNLIPSEWELPAELSGYEDYPEKWLFTLANDEVLIRAKRIDSSHGKYPIAVVAPDFDGYSQFPLSRLEITHGLQETLDWLFNSHIKNVRQAINNRFVVDPALINVKDLANPELPFIRLKESAWGKTTKDAVQQLQVHDVTREHIANAGSVVDMFQRISGATDGFMGIMRDHGERVSASESRSVSNNGMNRMGKMALLMSIMGLGDVASFYASNQIDYQSMEEFVKITETHPEELIKQYGVGNTVSIDPSQLNVPYHVIPRDGSLPKDTSGLAQSWVQLFQSVSNNPMLAQRYDVLKMFGFVAKMMGASELPNFELQGVTAPDQMVEEEVRKGNYVPVEG